MKLLRLVAESMHTSKTRLTKYLLLAFTILIMSHPLPSSGKLLLDVDNPNLGKMPIMVADFTSNQPGPLNGSELASIVKNDLIMCGLFDVVPVSQPLTLNQNGEPDLTSLAAGGGQALVTGSFYVNGNQLTLELKLYDIGLKRLDLGKRYTGFVSDHRYMVHMFDDRILEKITNVPGCFTSKIAFLDDTKTREIFVMDYDGSNLRQITNTKTINLSPEWAPDGKGLIFTSYMKGNPDLWYVSADGHRVIPVSHRKGLNASGRFAPNGNFIALSMSIKSIPKIFIITTQGNIIKQLTNGMGNDISPSWSPDGAYIAYVSDQAGSPQIYVAPVNGGEPKRITLTTSYNTDPHWSPKGDVLAFTAKIDGRFQVCTIRPDGSDFKVLTNKGSNQDPTWAPDGRMIAFASNREGFKRIFVMDSKGTVQVPVSRVAGRSPAWSPRL
ncbi:MAG: Tol-Pal system beta propeller repeat protein TolB [Desulfomonilaceae bacterium]